MQRCKICSTHCIWANSAFFRGTQIIQTGAGEGDRTLVVSLENFCSTIELHPQASQPLSCSLNTLGGSLDIQARYSTHLKPCNCDPQSNKFIGIGGGGRVRTFVLIRGQIYSLLPLTTRPPLQTEPVIIHIIDSLVKEYGLSLTCRTTTS